ncbi:HAD family hydrolase [Meridianimarinicoccus sp. RP-17]|uniref:HAD family hydrolase n=1 Tax=Meridianimarinicoccus zhengii TaxID=2056810 RepID=UPI000DADF546|nr:HAD family hydrolase [Phycocomes zhengii]
MFVRIAAIAGLCAAPAFADPLPSWADTHAKADIIAFVDSVTDPDSPDYVPPAARIAAFDNDGTLWAEQPVYFQFLYALDRLREKAEVDPSILTTDVLRAAAAGDLGPVLAAGAEGLLEVVAVSHSGMTVPEFQADVRDWLGTARHPETDMAYDAMLYQPMLELLRYLRDEGFTTWIVSGGGVHFIRAFAADAYNVPPWQVVGTRAATTYDEDARVILKDPDVSFIDDKAGKPVGIDQQIGAVPIFIGGNSDGDFAMLDYGSAQDGPFFGMIVHHNDADREFAYDRDSHVGALARGLDEGPGKGWLIVDMAADWARVWSSR